MANRVTKFQGGEGRYKLGGGNQGKVWGERGKGVKGSLKLVENQRKKLTKKFSISERGEQCNKKGKKTQLNRPLTPAEGEA